MNRKMILKIIGNILMFEGIIMILPMIVSLIYKEYTAIYFLITIVITLLIGYFFQKFKDR